ncbi:MAG TPA: hypothetical protein VJ901_00445 [Thermoanaerobaculia bacterium]|nr:hypothetical protein [Thermoanaerobaculia bacterium]
MKRLTVFAVTLALAFSAFAQPRRTIARGLPQPLRDATIDNSASCDISTSPAATLLLPYFEVEIDKHVSDAKNTIFSVINTTRMPQIARVTVWSDQGYPALWFNIFLTGFGVQGISLYDLVGRGQIPETSSLAPHGLKSASNSDNPRFVNLENCSASGGALPQDVLTSVQSVLTNGTGAAVGCRVGSTHEYATGYVTVDVVNSCSNLSPLDMSYYSQVLSFDNVLTGDYERIDPDTKSGNYAGGNPLVHLKAIPEGGAATNKTALPYTFYDRYTPSGARKIDRRQPLPAMFAARFIQGGKAKFFTDYVIWREGASPGGSNCTSANAELPFEPAVRFDEAENPAILATSSLTNTPMSTAIATTSEMFPPVTGFNVTGWMLLNLDNKIGTRATGNPFSTQRPSQNWLIVRLSAEGRYAVDYDATSLRNGCVNTTPAIASVKAGVEQ